MIKKELIFEQKISVKISGYLVLAGAIIWGIIAKFRNKMADISPLINSL